MASLKKISLCSSLTLAVLFLNIILTICTSAKSVSVTNTTSEDSPCRVTKTQRFLFHKETQDCYKEKSRGPCSSNMVIYPLDKDKIFGDCDCTEKGPLPWVYHPGSDNCYKTYQQSHCPVGQWLVFDADLSPTCEPNPCLDKLSEDEEAPTVLYKNKCVTLGQSSDLCSDAMEIINFGPNEVVPKCVSTSEADYSIVKTKQLNCKPGTRRDIAGRCRTIVTNIGTSEV